MTGVVELDHHVSQRAGMHLAVVAGIGGQRPGQRLRGTPSERRGRELKVDDEVEREGATEKERSAEEDHGTGRSVLEVATTGAVGGGVPAHRPDAPGTTRSERL